MMKWKARTETTNIGILELGNLTFNVTIQNHPYSKMKSG